MEQVLYPLPDGWSWQQLSDVVDKTENLNPLKHADQLWTYIDISSVDRDRFTITDPKEILGKDAPSRAKKHIQLNDVIFATTRPNLKNIALIREEYSSPVASTGFCIFRANVKVLPTYLFYFVTTDFVQAQIEPYVGGASYPAITDANLKKAPIPIPSIEEQKRIVEKLDALLTRIDTAIEHLQESITLADSLFESSQSEIFNDVLTKYQHSTIDEICTVTSSKRIFKADYVESGIPFYRTKEIVDLSKERDLSTELFIDKDKYLEISDKFGVPKKGDLLFSAVGTIGVMWIVDEREFYFKDGNLLWLKDMNGVIPEYLKSAISAVLTEKIKDRSQGAAYKAISITNLKAFEIPLPSIEEQKLTVAKIEHVSSLTKKTKQEIRLQINDLQKLKASILDSAFKGEL